MFRKWGEGWVSSGETGGPGPAIHRPGTDTDSPPPALSVRAVPGRLRKKKRHRQEDGIPSNEASCRYAAGRREEGRRSLWSFSLFRPFTGLSSPDHDAGKGPGIIRAPFQHRFAVDQNILDAHGKLIRVLERGAVVHRFRIEGNA